MRLLPWVGMRDASFVSRSDQQGTSADDFTVTVGAGLRGYLPTGKVTWAAHALPEYAWWQNDAAKRNFNGRFGLGLFGHFNRLRLELSQRRVERQAFFSDEVRELTSTRSDLSNLILEIDVARRLTIFGAARRRDFANEEVENPTLSSLDRAEESFEAGLRYESPQGLSLSLAYEDLSIDFADDARNLSNSGEGQKAAFGFDGSRFDASLALELRRLTADEGSEFGSFDDTTGRLELAWDLLPRLGLLTYARREQRFSIDAANAYSLYERQGARLEVNVGRSFLGLIGEVGEDTYTAVSTGAIARRDDVTAFGAEYRIGLDAVAVTARVYVTDYDSELDELDREVVNVSFGLELGGLIEKLRLGRPPNDW